MPQITSCPECSKKLRVPDELIGKKVKCPGCATMFIAEADDMDEAPPPPKKAPPKPPAKAPPERSRPDAVTSSPRAKRRDDDEDEEDEAPRPRAKRRDEDEEEERPSRRRELVQEEERPRRSRRDEEEDDDRRPRSRRDEEDEDRRPRSRRDEEEDDDDRRPRRGRDRDDDDDEDRPRGSRRGSEDSPAQQRRGWEKVRNGINLTALAGWTYLSTVGVMLLGGGVLLMTLGGTMFSLFAGNAGGATGGLFGMGAGIIIFAVIIGLIGLAEIVLRLVGMGLCMGVPKMRGSSMKGMAIAAFCCMAGAVLLNFTGTFIGGMSSGFSGPALMGLSASGNVLGLVSSLAAFVGQILWIIVLRSMCLELGDRDLGRKILTILIVQIVYVFVGVLVVFVMALIVGVSAASNQTAAGAVGTFGVGMILLGIFGVLLFGGWLAIYVWYVLTLQKIRDLVARSIEEI